MTAMKGQVNYKMMVIKLFSINYARDLVYLFSTLFSVYYIIASSITLEQYTKVF